MKETTPNLSLVILCYRSGEFAREFTKRTLQMLEDYGITSFELILVGNYFPDSGDRTPDIVRELADGDPRIRCQAEPKEGYMGWDLRSGLEQARGGLIAFIDGDGQMPTKDVGRLVHLMQDGDFDLVKTYRTARADGWKRRILTMGYNALFHFLFPGLNARDMNAKPKVLRRDAYEKMNLESNGWFIDAEIMIEARYHSMKLGELPTEFRCLRNRASFVSYGAAMEFLWNLLLSRLKEFTR
jgi:glycosyltransferase involved in cell wall biosynthesis